MKQESFDPGLTTQFSGALRRAINHDGSFNVARKGLRLRDVNPYLKLIDTTWPRFFLVVLLAFLVLNVAFAGLYLALGVENLKGAEPEMSAFENAFFFSVHTLTTVGYGNIYPTGTWANAVSAAEAATGLMVFALFTGLLYGRFSRPSARILFSDQAIIAPYQDGTSLQFRVVNRRPNSLMELEARIMLMTVEAGSGQPRRNYQLLRLERQQVLFLPLTWTVVHPIDRESPLWGRTAEDLSRLQAEVLILIKAYDDTFSQTVLARHSYRHDEMLWGARFAPAFFVDGEGDLVLELHRVGEVLP